MILYYSIQSTKAFQSHNKKPGSQDTNKFELPNQNMTEPILRLNLEESMYVIMKCNSVVPGMAY